MSPHVLLKGQCLGIANQEGFTQVRHEAYQQLFQARRVLPPPGNHFISQANPLLYTSLTRSALLTYKREPRGQLTKVERPVVVPNPLSEVDIRVDLLPVAVGQLGPQDGVPLVALDRELDVLRRAGEAGAAPLEAAFRDVSLWSWDRWGEGPRGRGGEGKGTRRVGRGWGKKVG